MADQSRGNELHALKTGTTRLDLMWEIDRLQARIAELEEVLAGTRQCEATTRGHELGGGRCDYRAKVKIAGSWLCGLHARYAPIPHHLLEVKPRETP